MTVKQVGQHWVIEYDVDNPPGVENERYDTEAEALAFDRHLEWWRETKRRLVARDGGYGDE